ncbi:Ectonucleotide pyrophosphatase/phosphodiesterase family member 1 [Triplophysa tibetana]|uniref:Ectonucleotide pyrophosphatase/phosphodiesterase family member 1 n=1 Tax=Triplophysa tibetana TaxID=1572043 RepID=A0A5A9NJ66_9TELE|nr:Ectonucleotide pyrophosphatase/phosphodiesterase family member 1 [Triplophysa tibetana]
MDPVKGDEGMSEHAANLLGSGQQSHRTPQSSKRMSRHVKFLVGILLLCLLALILTIIFTLKLHCVEKIVSSCKDRCVSRSRDANATCYCDAACVSEGTCCVDYEEVCVEPSEETWLDEDCEDIPAPQCPAGFSKPPLILVSLDGFRAGYMDAYSGLLPVINKLKKCGTAPTYMRPVYPTKTFPNHYTIVTGLYPESHGIVDNKMYDVTRNASFSLRVAEKSNPSWYQGEPIWLTAMKHKLKTATFFWPGSDVEVNGKYPDFWMNYERSISFESRVAKIFHWLHLPEGQRPDFYTVYMEEPDSSGHKHGPMSSQVIKALLNVDKMMGLLMEGLKQRQLHRCVNVILLSDHGMEEASCDKAEYVSKYLTNIDDITVVQGPAGRVRPRRLPEEFFSFDYEGLVKNLSCQKSNQPMRPYLKEHLPKRFHFANNVRIERAHLYMLPQWQVALTRSEIKYCTGGFHGSDNVFKNMQTIFIGYGPSMNYKTTVAPFENIEVYNLLCDLLGIPPAPNNGTHGSLNHLLKNPPHRPVYPAERSAPTTCTPVSGSIFDPLGCTCDSLTVTEVGIICHVVTSSCSNVKGVHLPFGVPRVLQERSDYCILQHTSYITAYSKNSLMPLWVSYSLNATVSVQSSVNTCVRADVRLQASARPSCSFYKNNSTLTFGLLHPPNLSPTGTESDSLITSNMVPMFPAFRDIWDHFHNLLLANFSRELNGVNVMSGPIFDVDFNGIYDIMNKGTSNGPPIPTHFFVILTSCKNSSLPVLRCDGLLDASAFILPHRPDHLETCHNDTDFSWVQDWVRFHAARIRDVELLTGLSFYHDRISVVETLELKTLLKTF